MTVSKKKFTQGDIASLKSGGTYDRCTFDECAIRGMDLSDCKFSFCSFTKCNMTGTKWNASEFTECDFSNANVAGCNFFSVSFEKCRFVGVKVSEAGSTIGTQWIACNFDYADMRALDLSGLDLSASSCIETDFSLANLKKTNFMNSRIMNAKFDSAKVDMTDFRGCELQGFSFTIPLKGAIFTPNQVIQLAEAVGVHVIESR